MDKPHDYDRLETLPELRRDAHHWRQVARTEAIRRAEAEAERDLARKSARDAWQFAQTMAKTGRMQT